MRHGHQFEDVVRRVAEAVWRLDPGECQPEWYRNDPILHELDGIARLPEVTHLLMATAETKLQKVKDDVQKLDAAEKLERKQAAVIKKWMITEHQLNAEHISYARGHSVEILTLGQFRDRFFHGRDYIAKRRNAAFGSSRNLRDGSVTIPENEYVALPMRFERLDRGKGSAESVVDIALESVVEKLKGGAAMVLMGPFGAGKSLTAREIFLALSREHVDGKSSSVPIAVNLREHWGALYADEILERHARSIGFSPKEGLTVAWRAGLTTLIVDGFDEVASQTIAKPSDRNFMRQVRHEALQATRDLIRKAPAGTGVLLCGRDHYFDSTDELIHALGLHGRSVHAIRVDEFTEEQASVFLRKHSTQDKLPDWLPRKPLILGYLAHQKLLNSILDIDASMGFGFAWDSFLKLVCEREAEHDRASMNPVTIRHVLERLACVARGTPAGDGPISSLDLADAYTKETGDVPGEGVLMQLQRLPGLTPRAQDPTARSFVDEDLLQALQGGAIARVILEGKEDLVDRSWGSPLGAGSVRMTAYLLSQVKFDISGVVGAAARLTQDDRRDVRFKQFAADCVAIAMEMTEEGGGLDCKRLVLENAVLKELDLEEREVSNLTLRGCGIEQLVVGAGLLRSKVRFEKCVLERVLGVPSATGLPSALFADCDYGSFDDTSTNAAIMRLNVPPKLKALMTVLRKLYLQAGGGRKLSALKRGLPGGGGIHGQVDACIDLLVHEGMVVLGGEVVHPVRRHTRRVLEILAAGALSKDVLVRKAMGSQ